MLPTTELDKLCRFIERSWPPALAAYREFVIPRLEPEDTDCVIEVFFVDESLETSVIRGTYQHRKRLRRTLGVQVGIVCHDKSDSISHYQADIMSLSAARSGGRGFCTVAGTLGAPEGFASVTVGGQSPVVVATDSSTPCREAYQIEGEQWTVAA